MERKSFLRTILLAPFAVLAAKFSFGKCEQSPARAYAHIFERLDMTGIFGQPPHWTPVDYENLKIGDIFRFCGDNRHHLSVEGFEEGVKQLHLVHIHGSSPCKVCSGVANGT